MLAISQGLVQTVVGKRENRDYGMLDDEVHGDIVLSTTFNNDMTFAGSPSPGQYNSGRANAANFEDACNGNRPAREGRGVGLLADHLGQPNSQGARHTCLWAMLWTI
jgi:hypothetical protein